MQFLQVESVIFFKFLCRPLVTKFYEEKPITSGRKHNQRPQIIIICIRRYEREKIPHSTSNDQLIWDFRSRSRFLRNEKIEIVSPGGYLTKKYKRKKFNKFPRP